jgi:hypothetical protein
MELRYLVPAGPDEGGAQRANRPAVIEDPTARAVRFAETCSPNEGRGDAISPRPAGRRPPLPLDQSGELDLAKLRQSLVVDPRCLGPAIRAPTEGYFLPRRP